MTVGDAAMGGNDSAIGDRENFELVSDVKNEGDGLRATWSSVALWKELSISRSHAGARSAHS